MVRFSCFLAHVHSHKHKKPVPQSREAMMKTVEDSSQKRALTNLTRENKTSLKEEEHVHNSVTDYVTDYSHTEHDCGSDEMDEKYRTDGEDVAHKEDAQIPKSQSVGSGLNWDERTSGAGGSEEEMEHRYYDDGSADHSRSVSNNGPLPSDSVQVDSDFAKNLSIFSIGDPEQTEREVAADKDDEVNSGDVTPTTPHLFVKSSSLPRLGSPTQYAEPFLPHSRSAEDMSTLYSRKKETMCEAGRQVEYQDRDDSMLKNTGADDTDEHYNYVDLAKDWIIPENMEKSFKGETSFNHSDEVPAKDFRLRRIEEWVTSLQECGPLEESNESAPCVDDELPKVSALTLGPTVPKVEDKVNPGMEAAKRYISSLNSSATAAQLTNLGLTVIPFLSVFVSLKALNLSGNSIARIVAGALPRGLHVLNLSKNNISTIEGLRDLTRLRVLDLSYNRILRIGHGLAGCSSIKELYLAGNKISEVEGLHRLLKLNVLDLRFNKISTTKCLGQLAANYNCLHALSLEGNPAQKNVGDDQLKKYVLSLLPKLTYYNRQPIKVGIVKDGSDRSARLSIGSHQSKTVRKATHGRKSQALASPKPTRSRHGRPPPTGMKTATNHQFPEISSRLVTLRSDFSFPRSRSEGNLGAL